MKLHHTTRLLATAVVAAAVAAPLSQAATSDKVQVAGSFVAPGQVSEAQLNAGHDPSTRLVQIGGALVSPSQASAYENGAGTAAAADTGGDSSALGTSSITAIAVLGSFAVLLMGSAVVVRRQRRSPTPAAC
jgi:hypothetical protein